MFHSFYMLTSQYFSLLKVVQLEVVDHISADIVSKNCHGFG